MANNNWRGLLTIAEIKHISADGEILWQDTNLKNLLHTEGEEYCLRVLFAGESLTTDYYFGLDARSSIDVADDMTDVQPNEPSGNGYTRQSVASDIFTMGTSGGVNIATSPVLTFSASGGSWGPVSNFFMTNESGYSGYLVSSVELASAITLTDGQSVAMKMKFALQDCP